MLSTQACTTLGQDLVLLTEHALTVSCMQGQDYANLLGRSDSTEGGGVWSLAGLSVSSEGSVTTVNRLDLNFYGRSMTTEV